MFKAKILFMTILLVNLSLMPVITNAETWLDKANQGGLSDIGKEAYDEVGAPQKSLPSIVAAVIKVFLGLLGIIFVVLLVIGGFKYMTSGGNEDKVQEAIKMIRNAVIGLLIIAAAYSITWFITIKTIPKIVNKY